MLKDLLYNQIVYNRSIKHLASLFLSSPLAKIYPYQYLYRKKMANIMTKYQKVPQRVMIENTNICNADCVFCPHKTMKRKVGIMDLALSNKITKDCRRLGINYLTIYGFGEPLLDKYFFDRVAFAKQQGIARVTTNTNAMYLNRQAAKRLIESGIDEVFISFDAATGNTYKKIRPGLDFTTVENNISFFVGEIRRNSLAKPKILLSFVESQTNRHEVQLYLKKWQNKVDGISVSLIHNWTGQIDNGKSNVVGFRDPCRLLWTDMVISWDGRVPLCCNDYENQMILGDIHKNTIDEIWNGQVLAVIRREHLKKKFSTVPICTNCTYNYHHKSPWWVA